VGEPVRISLSFRNASSRSCDVTYGVQIPTITDSSGAIVWSASVVPTSLSQASLAPGESRSWGTTTWDEHACTRCTSAASEGGQVPPGTYAVSAEAQASSTKPPFSSVPAPVPAQFIITSSGPPPCAQGDLVTSITTNKPSYALSETVSIQVTVHNQSSRACTITAGHPSGRDQEPIEIDDASGSAVWSPCTAAGCFPITPGSVTVNSGDTYVWATLQWEQIVCTDLCTIDPDILLHGPPKARPGTYSVVVTVSPPSPVTPASFTITGP
jgi:hypothetical protein